MRPLAALALAAALCASGCGGRPHAVGGRLQVAAAENVWGSIAAQVGGGRVDVGSVVANPATDPHDYEPSSADARAFAAAQLVIENGIGYDPWAARLVGATAEKGRRVLDVGDLVGVKPGGNPHRWYSPADVSRVARAIARDYAALDPAHAAYFRLRERRFERRGLATYDMLVANLRRIYRGTPVGASESIFAPLAQALGLRLVTPPSFLRAISEGADPTAGDVAAIERQIARRRIAVWVLNAQNETPDVARLTAAARAHGIPVATVTETLVPAGATFQSWQVRQLRALWEALQQ